MPQMTGLFNGPDLTSSADMFPTGALSNVSKATLLPLSAAESRTLLLPSKQASTRAKKIAWL